MDSRQTHTLATLACVAAGAIWGLYWIPLRALENSGISPLWATAIFYLVPFLIFLPIVILRLRSMIRFGLRAQGIAIPAGLTVVLYSNAFHYTDVLRAILLFYLTPIWSALLARVWLKEKIRPSHIVATSLGILGLLVILGTNQGFPYPRNGGDWMALASGFAWAVTANVMRRGPNADPIDIVFFWLFWSALLAVLLTILPIFGTQKMPVLEEINSDALWLFPVLLLLVIPGFYITTWGVPFLNPGTVGILFMGEIAVGVVSAALLTNEPFGLREIIGVTLIAGAGLTATVNPGFFTLFRDKDQN